tara:strand:- start:1632 stop:1982 length:351 start_codon:yes stop_codon:yes gene_type:complete
MNLGKSLWYLQRYSAVYFLVFLGYLEFQFWTERLNFEVMVSDPIFISSIIIFIVLACLHGFIGLWTVGTDYLTTRTLGFLSSKLSVHAKVIRKIYEFFFLAVGILTLVLYLSIFWF